MRPFLDRLRPFAPLAQRILVGVLFMVYGAERAHPTRFRPFLELVLGWHLPPWVAHGMVWGAIAGGALLVLGFLTRLSSLVLIAIAGIAMVKTGLIHGPLHNGADVPLLEIAVCLSLLLSGAGRFSVDRALFGERLGG